ncbi:sigma-54 interaction domain-containing protein [Ectobacillus panaciterrae]|uniref:sigma-54 interaction domain-containing protein n=1 Tax=Ectobacillus panaciterrae TaxID=363872 RepID=UPI00040561AB|nr:sigma 54-interacting transcriptional regulator [Ectobacillus panaciterrae]
MNNQKQLELINAELNDIFESSFDEIFVTDQHGKVVRVNATCERNYNVTANSLIGMHVKELEQKGIFYPSSTLQVIKHLKPIELFQKTGSGRYLHVRARPVFNEEGQLKNVISYSRDLTEIMQLRKKVEDMEEQLETYKKELYEPFEIDGFICKSEHMKRVLSTVQKVAKVNSTVLILGETGVGKSRLVKTIHQLSSRKAHVLNEINCAALPDQLIESELFGYEEGTFTGALRGGKKGLIELSHQGTLFLDEVGELSLSAQGKLLHVLQEKKIRPVGGKVPISVDIRIIAATNKNLEEMVEKGEFRRDLFYRLNVIPIHIPPLRERKEDILPIVYHFLDHFNHLYARTVHFSPQVLQAFLENEWKGNIREIENAVERLVVTADEVVTLKDLPFSYKRNVINHEEQTLQAILEEVEKKVVLEVFAAYQSTYKAAKALGISQSTAARKIRRYLASDAEINIMQ